MTKQEAAIKYITKNYLDYRRLRHDIVADKLQIRMADSLSAPHNATSVIGDPAELDSQEEGEWQYPMYQSDRKGTRGEIREY